MSTTFADHLPTGDHASRPSASAVPEGTLYSCTDHDLIYQSDGAAAWSTWATVGSGASDADAIHDNVAGEITAITEKVTPVDADVVLIEDSEDSDNKKRVEIGNLPGGGGGGNVPEWMTYLTERLGSETPHDDDDFFTVDTTADYTSTVPTGTLDDAISGGRLSLVAEDQVSQDICGYTKPVGSLTFPLTLETRVNLITQGGNAFGGLCFANGTTNSSSVIFTAVYIQGGAISWAIWHDTFENIATAPINLGLGVMTKDVYLRLCWKTTNTFRGAISMTEGVWLAFDAGDISDTQTPTRMGLMASNYGTTGLGSMSIFDYFRVYEADMITGIAL